MAEYAITTLAMKLTPDSLWLAINPVDMRIGIDGLSLQVQQALGRAPVMALPTCLAIADIIASS
jgi:hypothetical protein